MSSWRVATVVGIREETATARTLALRVPEWSGHRAGQHVDIRLTAPDGYTATRSYSIASASMADELDVTVERVADGEVSSFLTEGVAEGVPIEIRGPLGGWFVWSPDQPEPVQLVAGGSGIVPLMAMVRTHVSAAAARHMRLLYSVRDPGSVFYRDELLERATSQAELSVDYVFTRAIPAGWPTPPGRINAPQLSLHTISASERPTCYVCGPTGFVETVANLLVAAGHDQSRIRTERFGPTG